MFQRGAFVHIPLFPSFVAHFKYPMGVGGINVRGRGGRSYSCVWLVLSTGRVEMTSLPYFHFQQKTNAKSQA